MSQTNGVDSGVKRSVRARWLIGKRLANAVVVTRRTRKVSASITSAAASFGSVNSVASFWKDE